ncbi:unnamed protein product [Alternaria alternata]
MTGDGNTNTPTHYGEGRERAPLMPAGQDGLDVGDWKPDPNAFGSTRADGGVEKGSDRPNPVEQVEENKDRIVQQTEQYTDDKTEGEWVEEFDGDSGGDPKYKNGRYN